MLLPGLYLSRSRLVVFQAMLCDGMHSLLWVLCWPKEKKLMLLVRAL